MRQLYATWQEGAACGRERAKPVAEVLPEQRQASAIEELVAPVSLAELMRQDDRRRREEEFRPA